MTAVAGGLITLEYMLEGLKYGAKQTPPPGAQLSARDADIVKYIQAATPVIEHLVGAPILPRAQTQFRDGGKSAVLLSGNVSAADAVTAVRVDGQAYTGYVVDATARILYAGGGRRFAPGIRNVEVDVVAGHTNVPETLALAARELVRHWIQNGKQSPGAGAMTLPSDTSSLVDDEWAIPRRVRQLCAPFATSGMA